MQEDSESLNKFWTLLCQNGFVDIEHLYDDNKLVTVRFDIECNICDECNHITRFIRCMADDDYCLEFDNIDMTQVQNLEDLFKNITDNEKQCCQFSKMRIEESFISELYTRIQQTSLIHKFSERSHELAKEKAQKNAKRHYSFFMQD